MLISDLNIHHFRNIESANLPLNKDTLITGANGSGKTSILESLYLLSSGKSFRSSQIDTVITHGKTNLIVQCSFSGKSVGIQRFKNGKVSIRVNSKSLTKISDISRLLPVHLVEPNSIEIIEGAPSERRRFLDFAMFHVEHDYLSIFKNFSVALKHRNALLKTVNLSRKELSYWDRVYIDAAWELNTKRIELFDRVIAPGLEYATQGLLGGLDISINYDDGCKSVMTKTEFAETIADSFSQEVKLKATRFGPHRADIILKSKGKLAKDYLSRGQKKLLTYGVRLAPALMLRREGRDVGVILIDDMPSELDEVSVSKVCEFLLELDAQTLLTAVDNHSRQSELIIETMKPDMFHVEHGQIQRIER